ncbi:MAG: dephospho-CoA kinase [Acidobacteria bacterium]|nr:dephospho-CoA kinase [Acidobacteriota bacterium]
MFRVGLTGGIATGKSVVAEVFREEGAFVLDTDLLGHELMQPGTPAYQEIRGRFGDGILEPDGRIDRKKLGERIFGDERARLQLNAILHPRILAEAEQRVAHFARQNPGGIAVTQAALMAEAGAFGRFDRIVLTECDTPTQVLRLRARDGLGEEQALRRIGAQADSAARRRIAHIVLDTSGSLEETRAKARQAFDSLRREWESRQAAQ